METANEQDSKPLSNEPVSETSPKVSIVDKQSLDEKVQLQAMLSDARNTKLVLEEFDSAVKAGTYQGHHMIAIAKGLSFIAALLGQTKGHIATLQEKLKP